MSLTIRDRLNPVLYRPGRMKGARWPGRFPVLPELRRLQWRRLRRLQHGGGDCRIVLRGPVLAGCHPPTRGICLLAVPFSRWLSARRGQLMDSRHLFGANFAGALRAMVRGPPGRLDRSGRAFDWFWSRSFGRRGLLRTLMEGQLRRCDLECSENRSKSLVVAFRCPADLIHLTGFVSEYDLGVCPLDDLS